jgi:hypothetical protein
MEKDGEGEKKKRQNVSDELADLEIQHYLWRRAPLPHIIMVIKNLTLIPSGITIFALHYLKTYFINKSLSNINFKK